MIFSDKRSGFFRDPAVFELLKKEISSRYATPEGLRFWCCSCDNGEDAYSLAILLKECLDTDLLKNTKIFATDIDSEVINIARKATYDEKYMDGVSSRLKEKYFLKTNEGYKVMYSIRNMVMFGTMDIVKDSPISNINILLCRNLSINFDTRCQTDIFRKFDYALKQGGLIVLDKAETLQLPLSHRYKEIKKGSRVYRRREHVKKLNEKDKRLGGPGERFKVDNEECEVTYEEAQAQELYSTNEELKLVNEDLERKNIEIIDAHKIIRMEEEKLKRAKDKLRLIYDGINDYILLVDFDCTILEANRYFVENVGINESLVNTEKLHDILGLNEPFKNCPVKESIENGTPVEKEIATDDGKVLQWHSFPLPESDEEPRKAVVYIRDITEQRLLMQRLIQSDKLSSLGELVSGVAHELNNPLTAVMGFSELLLREVQSEGNKKKIKRINEASQRCKRIIDNLLTFARWHKPEKTLCDLNSIIRDTIELRAYQLKVSNIDLELNLAPSLPVTMADGHQLQQIFLNLINNAQHAMSEKGSSGKLTISTRCKGDFLQVQVSDTGKGIPSKIMGKIFDPFFTTKGVGEGTGLGLSISYGIMKEHNGNIYVTSNQGEGTTCTTEFPIVKMSAKNMVKPSSVTTQKERIGHGLNALVLDDEPIILNLMRDALDELDFDVDITSRGDEALKMLRSNDYHLLISDIKMPGMDGKSFYKELKFVKPEAIDTMVFVSGDSASKETCEFLEETGIPFLRKPFTMKMLQDFIVGQILKMGLRSEDNLINSP